MLIRLLYAESLPVSASVQCSLAPWNRDTVGSSCTLCSVHHSKHVASRISLRLPQPALSIFPANCRVSLLTAIMNNSINHIDRRSGQSACRHADLCLQTQCIMPPSCTGYVTVCQQSEMWKAICSTGYSDWYACCGRVKGTVPTRHSKQQSASSSIGCLLATARDSRQSTGHPLHLLRSPPPLALHLQFCALS